MSRVLRIVVGGIGLAWLADASFGLPWLRQLTDNVLARLAADALRVPLFVLGSAMLLFALGQERLPAGRRVVRILANVALVLTSLGLCLIAIEATLQYRYRDISVGGYDTPSGTTFYSKYYHVNRMGFRDTDHAWEKAAGTFRILVMGDSFTFGMGVRRIEDVYPKELERLLGRLDADVEFEVINASAKGWNTEQELRSLQETGLRYDPDLVILGYFLNDAEMSNAHPTARRHLVPSPWGEVLYKHSYTYFVLERRLASVLPGLPIPHGPDYLANYTGETFQRHDRVLRAFLRIAQDETNRPAVVLLFPSLHEARGEPYPYSSIHSYVAETAREEGAHCVDLLDPVRRSPLRRLTASAYDGHPNEAVHEMAAYELYRYLVREHLIPGERPGP